MISLTRCAHVATTSLCAILLFGSALRTQAAPTITVTKDDGTPAATQKAAGSTVTYTNTIKNTAAPAALGANDATGVQFKDPDVGHATAQTATLTATPVAIDDTYPNTVITNTSVDTSGSGFNVLTNDFYGYSGGTALILADAAVTVTVAAQPAHGTVSFNAGAKGTFVYTPAPGYTGADSFTYTIANGVTGGDVPSTTGTVNLTVGGPVIWFVNPNAASTGVGSLASPFKTLAEAITAIGASTSQRIFLYTSASTQTGNFILNGGGWLVGQAAVGASFDALMGVTYPGDTPSRPSINNATKPPISNSAGNTITLGENNTILGVAVANTGGGFAIAGSSVNTGTIGNGTTSDVTIGSSGSSNGGVSLTTSGNGNIPINAAITTTAGRSVSIANRTGGTVTFSQAISDSGNNGGILLSSNTGATINFNGGLSLNIAGNNAFVASGGGTVTATQNNTSIVNTITAAGATGLIINGTTIGANGLTFRSISAGTSASSAGDGILLAGTGVSGGLTVTGNGTAGSGGTIQHKTGANLDTANGNGIYLSNTANVSLSRMQLNDFDNFAIRGFGVTGFTMSNCVINGANGNSTANLGGTQELGEGSVYFGNAGVNNSDGLNGTVTISNCSISGGAARNLSIVDTSSAAGEMHATVTGCTFGLTQNLSGGNQSLAVEARNAGTVSHVTVTSSTFAGSMSDAMNFTGQTGTTMHVIVGGATLALGNTITNTHPGNILGGGSLNFSTQGIMFFDARNNTMSGADGSAVTFFKASGGTQLEGTFDSNTIGTSGVAGSGSKSGNAIYVSSGGAGAIKLAITNNTVQRYNGNGGIYADNTGGSYSVDMTVTGNTFRQAGTNVFAGLAVTNGSPSSGDTTNVVLRALNNDFSDSSDPAGGGADIYVTASGSSAGTHTFTLSGAAAADVASLSAIQTFLKNNNNLNGASAATLTYASVDAPVTLSQFKASASLPASPTIPTPLIFAAGGIEKAVNSGSLERPSQISQADVQTARTFTAAGLPSQGSRALPQSTTLSQVDLDTVVAAAIARWEATGLTDEQVARLHSMKFEVTSLDGNHLGEAGADTIRVDSNAGGNGWFTDPTAQSDALFGDMTTPTRLYTTPTGAPAGRVDLLTTILHEMGHALGLADSYNLRDRDSLMYGQLTKGERRLPVKDQAKGAKPFLGNATHFLTGTLNPITIGTLPVGKSVIITYDVQIENPIVGASQISSQATVHSTTSSFTDVISDDPNAAGATDPTITLLARPTTTVVSLTRQSGNPSKNGTVTWQVVFANAVDGLTNSNFSLVPSGVSGASISGVTETSGPPSTTWNITASTGTGDGTLVLNFVNDTTMTHQVTNAPFTGQVYTIDKTRPSLASPITISDTALKVGDTATVTFTFTEAVFGFDLTDLSVANATLSTPATSDGGITWTATLTPNASATAASNTLSLALTGVQDAAENAGVGTATSVNYAVDTATPTVTNVTSNSANGLYVTGNVIPITVTFSETVTVTGTPQLTLETGATDRVINYASGSGTSTLTFNYTVQAGDVSGDLDYVSTSSLALNGGTISDSIGNTAALTLPTPGAAGSLGANKAIIIGLSITQNTASRAQNATQLIITGSGFSATSANNTVVLSSGTATVTAATTTQLTCTLGGSPSLGTLNATVTVASVGSTGPTQVATIVAAPTVTTNTAKLAITAPTITIAGTHFDPSVPGSNTVLFNNGAAGNVTAASATSLTVTFTTPPTVGGSLYAVVTSFGGSSVLPVQVAFVAPVITPSSANLSVDADTITINGIGFSPTPADNVVAFDHGAVGSVTAASATQLTVTFSTRANTLGALSAAVTTNNVGAIAIPNVQVATINPGAATHFTVAAPGSATAGVAFNIPRVMRFCEK